MSGKIALIVDNEQTVRAYLKLFLRHAGFHAVEATNGVEALNVLRRLGPVVDVLLSDVLMPQMDGVALAHAVRAEFPSTPVILFSGYLNATQMRDLSVEFLQKPFPPTALLAAISRAKATIAGETTPKKEPQSEKKPNGSKRDAKRQAGG